MQLPKPFRILLLAVSLFLLARPAVAQSNLYLDVAGVQGESTAAAHPKSIVGTAFSLGCANEGSGVQFQELAVTKNVDRASPLLMLYSAQATNIATVNLYAQKNTSGGAVDYYVIKLTNAKVSSVSQGGSVGGTPAETVTFRYQKIEIDYTTFSNIGQPNGTVVMTWDLSTNQPF